MIFAAPTSLVKAITLAKRAESCNSSKRPTSKLQPSYNSLRGKDKTSEPARQELGMDKLGKQLPNLVIKKLETNHAPTPNYATEITCFNCQGTGHKAWFCPQPNLKRKSILKGKGLEPGGTISQ